MSQRKAKIPRIFVRRKTRVSFALTDAQWGSIEEAYGRGLDSTVRDHITDSTNEYLRFAEADTGTMEDAINRIHTLEKAGRQLLASIEERPASDITRRYVDDEIALWGPAEHILDYVPTFSMELTSFLSACEKAGEKIEGATAHCYWEDGWAWQGWINQLILIFKQHSLPVSARQDTDKAKDKMKSSSFVKLVQKLQSHLPDHVRSTHSDSALAQAVNKARRRTTPPVRSVFKQGLPVE
jgi:hypothetical protein